MVEAVAGVQHVGAAQDLRSLPTQQVELSDAPLQQPSHAQASDFVRATETLPIREVNAAPVQPRGWTDGIESLASHLQDLDAGPKPVDSSSEHSQSPEGGPKDVMADLLAQMDRTYMASIEAAMIGHGTSEVSKVFNTLLKGQ